MTNQRVVLAPTNQRRRHSPQRRDKFLSISAYVLAPTNQAARTPLEGGTVSYARANPAGPSLCPPAAAKMVSSRAFVPVPGLGAGSSLSALGPPPAALGLPPGRLGGEGSRVPSGSGDRCPSACSLPGPLDHKRLL